jgi:uncharacterized protein
MAFWAGKIALVAALLYAAYVAALYAAQATIIFPRYLIRNYDLKPPADTIRTLLETSFGEVEAWYLPPEVPPSGAAPAVIFAHGNAELIDFWPVDLGFFRKLGLGVLLVEYPGYGRSAGVPSEATVTEAFTAGYDWLAGRKDVDGGRIILCGRSIGGGAACALARQRRTAGMILISTFTSIKPMAARHLFPPSLLKTPFDNLSTVGGYQNPILIAHGTRDTIIPFSHARRLHEAAPDSRLLALECGHNDCPLDGPLFLDALQRFLAAAGIVGAGAEGQSIPSHQGSKPLSDEPRETGKDAAPSQHEGDQS